jgi:hypothetical protein
MFNKIIVTESVKYIKMILEEKTGDFAADYLTIFGVQVYNNGAIIIFLGRKTYLIDWPKMIIILNKKPINNSHHMMRITYFKDATYINIGTGFWEIKRNDTAADYKTDVLIITKKKSK